MIYETITVFFSDRFSSVTFQNKVAATHILLLVACKLWVYLADPISSFDLNSLQFGIRSELRSLQVKIIL